MNRSLPPVICCPPAMRPAALRQLHDALPADQQIGLALALELTDLRDAESWAGLLVVLRQASTASPALPERAAWVQPIAGNTAVVWVAPDDSLQTEALVRSAAALVDARKVPLAQLVVGKHDGYPEELLGKCGFSRFAELLHLYADAAARDPSAAAGAEGADSDLQFQPGAGDEPERLGVLLERTYVDTLDCPALDGVRPMDDVLAGYRAQGRYAPERWFFVRQLGVDVAALLLAEHPGTGNWELIYMGVVPAARGRGLGARLLRFAQTTAARGGAERLVLAVDSQNAPALAVYQAAGFMEWDRRIVYARLQERA